MKINLGLARKLQDLSKNKTLSVNIFSTKEFVIIEQLLNDRVLFDDKIIRRRKVIYCKNKERLQEYLKAKFSINSSLTDYINVLQDKNSSKSDMVRVSGDAKLKKSTSLDGFLLKAYDDITATINKQSINLKNVNEVSLHINDWRNFQVDDTATIVVVENSENFKLIHKQKRLFKGLKPIFLFRFANSTAISTWIGQVKNDYLHFGDFDLKGIHIYITEFKQKINNPSRCRYYIPDGIENMIKKGNPERYYKQKQNLKNFDFSLHTEISNLVNIINNHKKGLDQEFLIDFVG